jgi:hypothetical protein
MLVGVYDAKVCSEEEEEMFRREECLGGRGEGD